MKTALSHRLKLFLEENRVLARPPALHRSRPSAIANPRVPPHKQELICVVRVCVCVFFSVFVRRRSSNPRNLPLLGSPSGVPSSRRPPREGRGPKSMASELILWLLCFFAVVSLLGILVYQLMCLSDLEFDYINPFDSSSRINSFIVPEFGIHIALGCMFLLTGHWLLFLLNVPLAYYHINLYLKKQHLLDVTEIFNLLDREKKYRMVKLAFYLLLFFIVIYKLVLAAVYLILEHENAVQAAGDLTGMHADM